MNRPSGSRKTASSLSDSVHHQLNMYALAASAAGVGMLALAQPSEAKIVYTHANVLITSGQFSFDLNHDGTPDVTFNQGFAVTYFQGRDYALEAQPLQGNGIEEGAGHSNWAAVLKAGAKIGHSQQFRGYATSSSMTMAFKGCFRNRFCHTSGLWFYTQARYLGVKFQIKGKTHFGWMRLKNSSQLGATVTGYAYETIPGKAIIAGQTKGTHDPTNEDFGSGASLTGPTPDTPQPTTLGMLALGAQGVPLLRRKENESVLQGH